MTKIPNETNLPNTPGGNDHNEGSSGEADKQGQLPIVGQGSYTPDDMRKLQFMAMTSTSGSIKEDRKGLLWILISLSAIICVHQRLFFL